MGLCSTLSSPVERFTDDDEQVLPELHGPVEGRDAVAVRQGLHAHLGWSLWVGGGGDGGV